MAEYEDLTDPDRALQVEAIAGVIADRYLTAEEATAINRGDGWTIDVRYPSGDYISSTDYTRTSGIVLDAEELARALALAEGF